MLEQTYSEWLAKEVLAIQYALLVVLEKRDNLLYIEAPALREEYMQKIGIYEEQVLKAELEVALAEKKKQLIQISLNRREPVDLEAIEKQLEEERKHQLELLNQNYRRDFVRRNLSPEEKEELQRLYKEIVEDFHPEVHKNLTDYQKQLYQRALCAYQKQNLEELKLTHEMLYVNGSEKISIEISFDVVAKVSTREDVAQLAKELTEDYSLAAEIFECFEPLEEDGVFLSTKQQYEAKEQEVWEEIERIQAGFPFAAKETLQREEMTGNYLKSLEARMNSCNERLTELNRQIAEMAGV